MYYISTLETLPYKYVCDCIPVQTASELERLNENSNMRTFLHAHIIKGQVTSFHLFIKESEAAQRCEDFG